MKGLKLILVFILLFFSVSFNSCKKEPAYMNDGILTGFDQRVCACCGGLMITFSNNITPYSADFKLIDNWSEIGIQPGDKFPVYIKVDWEPATGSICSHIKITRFKRK